MFTTYRLATSRGSGSHRRCQNSASAKLPLSAFLSAKFPSTLSAPLATRCLLRNFTETSSHRDRRHERLYAEDRGIPAREAKLRPWTQFNGSIRRENEIHPVGLSLRARLAPRWRRVSPRHPRIPRNRRRSRKIVRGRWSFCEGFRSGSPASRGPRPFRENAHSRRD